MLDLLELRDTGPAPSMRFELAPRLNLFAGDNGLGKTFILDIAWWVLSGTWSGLPAAPRRGDGGSPTIDYQLQREDGAHRIKAHFDFAQQFWSTTYQSTDEAKKTNLVLYVRVDGSFSIWDPLRVAGKYRLPLGQESFGMSSHFQFNAAEVWDGLQSRDTERTVLCNGLIRDWLTWQLQGNGAFETLARVLAALSPDPAESIRPGASTMRLSVHDVRDIPTVELPHGTIAVVHASAGMKRILSLAYLLVWMWREHVAAAQLRNVQPDNGIVLLFDEVEAHLHPRWQRVILPALFKVIPELEKSLTVQILATTHAPLVLASAEPLFDQEKDALFVFEVDGKRVSVAREPFTPRGDASSWLTSNVFDLKQARSVEAETAIQRAMTAMRDPKLGIEELRRVHRELHALLKDTDPFWARWLVRAKQAGIAP